MSPQSETAHQIFFIITHLGFQNMGRKPCYWRKDSYVLLSVIKKNKDGLWLHVGGCYSVLHSLYLWCMLPWIEVPWLQGLLVLLFCREWCWIASLPRCRSSREWQLLSAAGEGLWREAVLIVEAWGGKWVASVGAALASLCFAGAHDPARFTG